MPSNNSASRHPTSHDSHNRDVDGEERAGNTVLHNIDSLGLHEASNSVHHILSTSDQRNSEKSNDKQESCLSDVSYADTEQLPSLDDITTQSVSSSSTEIYEYGSEASNNVCFTIDDACDINSTTDTEATQYSLSERRQSGSVGIIEQAQQNASDNEGLDLSDNRPVKRLKRTATPENQRLNDFDSTLLRTPKLETCNNEGKNSLDKTSVKSNITTADYHMSPRVKRSKINTRIRCPHCNVEMQAKSLTRHLSEIHKFEQTKHSVTCIDAKNAVFMVSKTADGIQFPVHVQNKNWGEDKRISCELDLCMSAKVIARQAGNVSWICDHLQASEMYLVKDSEPNYELYEHTLNELIEHKIFSTIKKEECLQLLDQAKSASVPLIVEHTLKVSSSDKRRYFSVFCKERKYNSVYGRVLVTLVTDSNEVISKCCMTKSFCVHKCTMLWYVYQRNGLVIQSLPAQDEEFPVMSDDGHVLYPPKGKNLKTMIEYIYETKKTIPCRISKEYVKHSADRFKRSYIPPEKSCESCNGDLKSFLVTSSGKVITQSAVISGK